MSIDLPTDRKLTRIRQEKGPLHIYNSLDDPLAKW